MGLAAFHSYQNTSPTRALRSLGAHVYSCTARAMGTDPIGLLVQVNVLNGGIFINVRTPSAATDGHTRLEQLPPLASTAASDRRF